jgi:uridine phosphorylase
MMQRDIHFRPQDFLDLCRAKPSDFGKIALVSGQVHRAKMCLDRLEKPVKNFSFLGYNFWTGIYKGEKITVGNGGLYSPDSAFIVEMLCVAGIKSLIRLGSCGGLRKDIKIGDYILAEGIIKGDGATSYYVAPGYEPKPDKRINRSISRVFSQSSTVHSGVVWTTDALFKETKEVVNYYIKRGAIAVDMVSSPFLTISSLYDKKCSIIITVSDNLITGELGVNSDVFKKSEKNMVKKIFEVLDEI